METETSKKQQVLAKLHKRDVHFVLCRPSKAALETGWQRQAASLDSVLKHDAGGGLLGFIPGRSGLWVLDADKFPGEDKDTGDLLASVSALATVATPRGLHAYFKKASSNPVGNRAWAVGGYSGDIRADHGYIILWKPHRLADALDMLPSAPPTAVELFPKPRRSAAGGRNNKLNKDVFAAARRGQNDFAANRAAALASGLPPAEADATIRSARTAGAKAAAAETLSEKTLANELDLSLDGRFCYALEHQGGSWLRREADGLWQPDKNGAALRKIIREHMDSAPKMQRGSAVSGVETLLGPLAPGR